MAQPPIYLDWTFWAFVSSAIAVVLSQLPPARYWFRPGRLSVDADTRISLTHMVGFPNATTYLSLRNTGGRPVRVRRIHFDISRGNAAAFTLNAKSYYPAPDSEKSVILVPFTIAPGVEWGHTVVCHELLNAQEDRELGAAVSALRMDISAKAQARDATSRAGSPRPLVTAEPKLLDAVLAVFKQHFPWLPGEYQVAVRVTTDQSVVDTVARYRFTLYESGSEELKHFADHYQHGFFSDPAAQNAVPADLHPV